MDEQAVFSRQVGKVLGTAGEFLWFFNESPYARLAGSPGALDFALGNPQDLPLPGIPAALQKWSVPQTKEWFAYKMSEPGAQEIVAHTLGERTGLDFAPQDIFMTSGAFAALSTAVTALTDPGDEIIYISPPWFFYEPIIVSRYGVPVRVACRAEDFGLDLAAIEAALTRRTRAIIVNTPNNPTGRIYPPEMLRGLAQVLERATQRFGRPVYLLADESYNRIVYDGRRFHSPSEFYPRTLVIYTYGKTLLAPGQRIGYIALAPGMAEAEALRPALFMAQVVNGYTFPNALLQHALPDLEGLSIDIHRLQAKRDRLVPALQGMGYELRSPEGTFYLLVRSPLQDDREFIRLLGEEQILCLPGSTFEMPGYFRISLTASEAMVKAALPGFARAMEKARQAERVQAERV